MSARRDQDVIQPAEEYLTVEQVAARLQVKPKTVRNKMASGIFQKGTHYFSPRGLGPRFKWSALQAWLEGTPNGEDQTGIPMRGGYHLNAGTSALWKRSQ
jgi:hypothetical protein